VSSVACFAREEGAFTIDVDVSDLRPSRGHYIYLILWADANGNDDFDVGEEWKYVIPLYDDCIFQRATDCVYYYDECANERTGTEGGWNQSVGLERYVPVARAPRDGARLCNDAPWSARAPRATGRTPAD